MEKTIKQIADDIGVDKQKVYRVIKKYRITASSEVKQSMMYDETAQRLIKRHFYDGSTSNIARERYEKPHQNTENEAVMEQLIKELEAKNEQIRMLQEEIRKLTDTIGDISAALKASQESVKAAQVLQANAEAGRNRIEQKPDSLWQRIFRTGKGNE